MSFQPGNSDRSILIRNQLSLKIVTSLPLADVAVRGFEACFLSNNHLWLPQWMERVPEAGEEDGVEGISSISHPLHPFACLDGGQLYPAPKSHENIILITAQLTAQRFEE